MTPGTHGSTFAGSPLSTRVANAVLDQILKKNFLKNVNVKADYFHSGLQKLKKKYPNIIKEIRGRGLLIGVQLYDDQSYFINKLRNYKLLTIKASENVVRILPPLNVKKNEISQALEIMDKVCSEIK